MTLRWRWIDWFWKVLRVAMPFFGGLFFVLKMLGVIDWGWSWVLTPIWAPFVIMFFIAWFENAVTSIRKGR